MKTQQATTYCERSFNYLTQPSHSYELTCIEVIFQQEGGGRRGGALDACFLGGGGFPLSRLSLFMIGSPVRGLLAVRECRYAGGTKERRKEIPSPLVGGVY